MLQPASPAPMMAAVFPLKCGFGKVNQGDSSLGNISFSIPFLFDGSILIADILANKLWRFLPKPSILLTSKPALSRAVRTFPATL